MLLLMLGCTGSGQTPLAPVVAVSVAENPDNPFSRILTIEGDVDEVVVSHAMGTTPPQPPGEVLVLGLAADTTHTLTVIADGVEAATVEVTTDPLPEGWERCEASGETATAHEVVCTNGHTDAGAHYFCVDRAGTPVFSLTHPDGDTLLAVRSLPDGGFAAVGDSRSVLAIFDERGALTGEVIPLDLEGVTRFEHGWIDMHEVIAITEGQWAGAVAVLTATGDEVDGRFVIANGVLVVDPVTLEVLWDWSAHGERGDDVPIDGKLDYERTGWLSDDTDWQHANALLHRVRPDGGEEFWLSLRTQDWIIAVDAATDAVRWRLGEGGDFAGDDTAWFYQQHAPELRVVDGQPRVLLFDNGTVRPGGEYYSRVIELALDETAMTATLTGAVDGFYSAGHGDADLLPDGERLQYVVGWADVPYVEEVAWPGGGVTWRLDCPETVELYRATFFPSLYDRAWWYEVPR